MNSNRREKVNQVTDIKARIKKSTSIIAAEYHGLTVSQITDLRNKLKEKDIELVVLKNRLVKLALKGTKYDALANELTGPNVFAFCTGDDDIAPSKIMVDFSKENEALKIKAGTYEGKVIDAKEIQVVASLPSLPEALTMLASSMIGPVRYIGTGLHMLVKDGKING